MTPTPDQIEALAQLDEQAGKQAPGSLVADMSSGLGSGIDVLGVAGDVVSAVAEGAVDVVGGVVGGVLGAIGSIFDVF